MARRLRRLPENEFDIERRKRIDAYLDQGQGACYLRDERIAGIVQNALLRYDGLRYALHAWVIMPNHVHTLFTSQAGWELSQIAHSWKSYTASECNRVLGRKGEFWQREPFDRYIRDERHFENAVRYIENNPVNAGCAPSLKIGDGVARTRERALVARARRALWWSLRS